MAVVRNGQAVSVCFALDILMLPRRQVLRPYPPSVVEPEYAHLRLEQLVRESIYL